MELADLVTWAWWSTNAEILRNLGLLVVAAIGLPLAIWRTWVAHQQAKASLVQANTSQAQLEGNQQQLKLLEARQETDRFQQAAEMLGSDDQVVRLGGIYALRALSDTYPRAYGATVSDLCWSIVVVARRAYMPPNLTT